MSLPQRVPGASGYQRWLEGDLGAVVVRVAMPQMAVPLADPTDPLLWAKIEKVLADRGIEVE